MLTFARSSVIPTSVEALWRFHQRPDCWRILTPPWQPVEIVQAKGGLAVGNSVEYRLWIGIIPVQWIFIYTECQTNCYFVDQQQTGPMEFWQHRHQFDAEGDKTRLTDQITFALPGGQPGEMLLDSWVHSRLSDMFDYRHRLLQRYAKQGNYP